MSKRNKILPDICLIDSKWVFKKNKYGQFRAHLLERGYTQILGVEINNNYAQVVHEIALRIIILMGLFKK